ncbi:CHAP domain-containing protein [Weissella paramesenteroides]|uniref:phage tail tape measure protein n=1 Tax=Weissella paramesenteroides TaxID=1249 RepID=UPI00123968A4|nr:phage tail tape measure protein [Weissella paramesenteroides]KAA8439159.1 CHAP domain-containing protein [Weissella paramesenteroides]KAA8440133.1 CHAP domain-containing protein [Weissella paramesenteroides]KAA8443956.1 CHAP domain-containing protein [Weissella paramesenteroides]KAA8446437.1 CHAP domain-containing protein [Weissella paramesenteroides]KAA8451507.1 CHAP domain-containing protein [Weissella paramesenteroides]
MAKEKVANLMSTGIGLDTTGAVQSINQLKQSVAGATNEWKQMESSLKRSGDELGASEARYKGLSDAVGKQSTVLDELKRQQGEVNRSTEAGEQTYQKYESQIAQAERKLTSLTAQQAKAEQAYHLQESGIASLNKEIRQNIQETDAQVERLKAEGKETEANEAQKKGLSATLEKQTKLYEAQSQELKRLTESGEASADSISKQKIALDKTGTSIAKSKQSLAELDGAQSAIGKNNGAEEAGSKMEGFKGKVGKSKEALIAMGATATAVLATVAKGVKDIYDSQAEVSTLQGKTTLSYKQAKSGIAEINKLYAQGYGDSIDELQETYAKLAQLNPNASVKELAENTKLVSTYAKQSGADVDEVMQGADKATRNWGISYQEYFDNMSQLQKMGDDQAGDISDNMAEYSQVLGQMGLSISDSMALIDNGVKSGAYNGDKLLDFTKEFQISLNDGRMDKAIGEFSKKSQDMFKGYKEGKVSAGDMFKQITGEMGKMTDKQKEATVASNLWSALGEDNSLKVIESLGKTNDKFDDVKGTAKKTSDQLKESNPFELMKRSAEASVKSISLNAGETKKFKASLKPLQKALKDLIEAAVNNLPKLMAVITPALEFISKHGKLIVGILTTLAGLTVFTKTISGLSKVSGAIGSTVNVAKKAKDSKAFKWSAKLGKKGFDKSWGAIKATGSTAKKWGKSAFSWSANLGKKAFTKSLSAIKTAGSATGKFVTKSLKFTANVATKAYSIAMAGLVKTAKVTGSGIKLAFNFLKANPLILLITGITATVVALTTLYKHNKKFRDFVNGLVKSAQDFFKGIAKWFGEAYKKVLSIFKAILKFMKNDWKEILLLIVNPISGAFALTYKHNAKFRKAINDLVKDVLKFFTNMGKGIANVFTGMWRNITKVYNSILKFIRDTTNDIGKIWSKGWQSISNFFGGIWNGMKKFGHDSIWSIKNTFDDVLGKIGSAFSNTWKSIKSGFSDMWTGMKQLAGDGINAVIKIPNAGISGINGLIHDFGGPKHAIGHIPKVKFANGTGAIKKLTHAVLNDGNDSPATGNKEMLIHPNGATELVQGRNTERLLLPGTEVLNASETAMLMRMQGITHFASGTGFWSRLWGGVTDVAGNAWSGLKNGVAKFTKMLEFITNAVAHPVKTLESKLSLKTAGLDSVYKDFGGAFFSKVKGQAKDWWSTLWNMANDASSAGADGGMKGDDYRYKGKVADSGADPWGYFFKECVSFVASRLANLGVSTAKFSHLGNGMDWVNASVPHMSKPKVGSVAVYGPGSEFGNHVAMVTGVQGNKISGEEYNWNGDHKYHTYHGRNASGATTFLDFGLSSGSSKSDVKADSPLAKLIKKQTGGMLGWIQKFIAPLNDSSTGVDGDVHSWADDVKKALRKLNLSDSASMVQKVLRQINTESRGNPKAIGGTDGYNEGHATGLMQVKPPTFNAYALPGHKDIFNGYDNILAGLNYAKHRYGNDLSYLGNGHGYENGGFISTHGFYEIAERNMPEVVIPLDPAKKPRASELLAETTARIHGNETPTASQTDLSRVESKLDKLITLLTLVLGVNKDQLQALTSTKAGNQSMGLTQLMNQMGLQQQQHNFQSI